MVETEVLTREEFYAKYPVGWVNEPDENGHMFFSVECTDCRRVHSFRISPTDMAEFASGVGRNIQQIFTYLDDNQRELLLNRICGDCYDSLFEGLCD